MTDRTPHNNRPDIMVLNKTVKKAYIRDIAIFNGHNLHGTITKKLQKYTDLKKELVRMW
jgi:hypothetical protein